MSEVLKYLSDFLGANDATKHIAFIDNQKTYTYADTANTIASLIILFKNHGVQIGDKIVVGIDNSFEFACCYFAAIYGGFAIVPLDTNLPEDSVQYIIKLTQPKLIIRTKESLIVIEVVEGAFQKISTTNIQEVCAIFFTSGTTGIPKGVCHTANSLLANAYAFNQLQNVGRDVKMLHIMPMSYMAGFLNTVVCPLIAGGTVIIAPKFNAANAITFWDMAMENGANSVWMSPTIVALITRLNRSKEIADWVESQMRHVFVGTAALQVTVKQAFELKFHSRCLESYGSTEMLLVASQVLEEKDKLGSVGKVVEGTVLKVNEESKEISIHSKYAFQGYFKEGNTNSIAFKSNEWFLSGDCGHIDEDRYLFITDRKKDLIIRGGMNISPEAVENVLLTYHAIKGVAIVGKKHSVWGEEVIAFIELEDNVHFDEEDCKHFCVNKISADVYPKEYHIIDKLPRSSIGKIQKKILRDQL